MHVKTKKKLFGEFFVAGSKQRLHGLQPSQVWTEVSFVLVQTCLLHSRACKSRHNSRLVILQGSSLLIFSHAVREGIDEQVRAPAMDKEEQ